MGPGWCPYNSFRTSGDIVNLWDRVMSNLQTVVPFLSPDTVTGTKHGGGPAPNASIDSITGHLSLL